MTSAIPFLYLPQGLGRAAEVIESLPLEECERLYKSIRYRWSIWSRPKQRLPETGWDVAYFIAGRGGGKTRPGAEWVMEKAKKYPGCRIALVGRTARDVRDTMLDGESGILRQCAPWFRPRYYPSKRLLMWPNKSQANVYTSQEPSDLRGPQHHFAWGDEFASWLYQETYSNLLDGLRLGEAPQVVFTSTPRRLPWFLDAILGEKDAKTGQRPVTREMIDTGEWSYDLPIKDQFGREIVFRTIARRWSTEANSLNLSPGFAAKRRAEYGESSFGRQELDAEILDVVEGALWKLGIIDLTRVERPPQLHRKLVIVDPSHSTDGRRDACGIVAVGAGPSPDGKTAIPHAYVLGDATTNGSPIVWGRAAVSLYDRIQADAILYEANESPGRPNLVKSVIGIVDPKKRIKWIPVFSARDKRTRADPVAGLYEAERVHHTENPDRINHLAALEEEMVAWDPWDPKAPSPNRVDALVHGITYLLIQSPGSGRPIAAPIPVGGGGSPSRM